MDELEDAIGALKDMAVNFTCLMFEKTQAVLKGAMHMVWWYVFVMHRYMSYDVCFNILAYEGTLIFVILSSIPGSSRDKYFWTMCLEACP